MKLGVMSALFGGMTLDEALRYCQKVGLEAIELPAGAYPGDPWKLGGIHKDKKRLAELKAKIADHGLEVRGVAVHGNPVHPHKLIAHAHQQAHRNGVMLAAEFGTVAINFSGCPGGGPNDHTPNFVTCPWPDDFSKAADYQWNKVLIPFWSKEKRLRRQAGREDRLRGAPRHDRPQPRGHRPPPQGRRQEPRRQPRPQPLLLAGHLPRRGRPLPRRKRLHLPRPRQGLRDRPRNSRVTGNLDIKSYGDVKNRSWSSAPSATATATSSGSPSSPCSASTATTARSASSTRTR